VTSSTSGSNNHILKNENDTSNYCVSSSSDDDEELPHFDYASIRSPSPPILTPMASLRSNRSSPSTHHISDRYDGIRGTDNDVEMQDSSNDSDTQTLQDVANVRLKLLENKRK
jgi:hypothetical protein